MSLRRLIISSRSPGQSGVRMGRLTQSWALLNGVWGDQ